MTDNNVIDFPRIGFNLTPTQVLDAPVVPPPPSAPPTIGATPNDTSTGGRRSPFDVVSALPDPGLTQPLIPATHLPAPAAGFVPDTFRSEPTGDMVGPRLGALSLAAVLAVAVAALRGTHTTLTDWRQRRLARRAETDELRQARQKMQLDGEKANAKHALAMQDLRSKAAQQRAKKVPSSHEFGRKTLNRSSGSSSNRTGGGGTKKTSSGSSSTHANGGSGKHRTKGSLFGGGSRHTGNENRRPKDPKSPHRGSQGAGGSLKKQQLRTNSGSGHGKNTASGKGKGGRTTLAGALAKDGQKTAARRLKQRRKHDLNKPALWSDSTRTKKNGSKNSPSLKKPQTPGGSGQQKGNAKKVNLTKNAGSSKAARTTLRKAMWRNAQKTAAGRWKKRAQDTPPLWTNPKQNKKSAGAGAKPGPGKKQNGPQQKTAGRKKTRGSTRRAWWAKARAYARKKAAQAGKQRGPQNGAPTGSAGYTPPPPGGTGTRQRRSPFENAGTATASTADTVYEWPGHEPHDQRPAHPGLANDVKALAAAPTPHTQRPGTTRPNPPIPMPSVHVKTDTRIKEHRRMAAHSPAVQAVGRQMDAQHATDITLDDACDAADKLAEDAFTTHDETGRLAKKARDLRDTWLLFADDLATNHNLIGALFTSAALKFAESMDLVARMADEMETSSLEAAEKAETAGNELNDAYRPITQATADAGLTTPSAPIHNQV